MTTPQAALLLCILTKPESSPVNYRLALQDSHVQSCGHHYERELLLLCC